jgi:hypothetical protein
MEGFMALRGKKPTEIKKRLKAFFYGPPGGGKTTAAIQFPCPYLIDTERGAEFPQYVKLLSDSKGVIFQTTEFDEILSEVRDLISQKHPYKTLIIDTLTVIYDNLLDAAVEKGSKNGKDGTEHGRHYGEANRQMTRLFKLLSKLDMNVIITSHIKNEYGPGRVIIGKTFDCFGKVDRIFDLAIEIRKLGKDRTGLVKKTRIDSFEEGESFNFSYAEVADRYGKEAIEKEVTPQKLPSKDQVSKMQSLIHKLRVPPEKVLKWLEKANATEIEDMNEEFVIACIESMEKKLNAQLVVNQEPEVPNKQEAAA